MEKNFVLPAFVFVSVILCAPLAQALEKPELHFDKRSWSEGYKVKQEGLFLAEFVLDGQTVQNWKELVTAQFFQGLKAEPPELAAKMKSMITGQCPDSKWNEISKTAADLMYEWSIAGCAGQDDQTEITRIIKTKKGTHVLHYAIKTPRLGPEKRQEWIDLLNASRILEG